jgi:hypothetical protein
VFAVCGSGNSELNGGRPGNSTSIIHHLFDDELALRQLKGYVHTFSTSKKIDKPWLITLYQQDCEEM